MTSLHASRAGCLAALVAIFAVNTTASSGRQASSTPQLLRIVIRSFIPNEHLRDPGYVRAVPGTAGLFVIPSPETGCFATDGRGFSTSLDAASRATTEFVLIIEGTTVKLATAANRDMFRVEPLRTVDCQTGGNIVPPRTPFAQPMTIDTMAVYQGIAQVVFSASVSNPFCLSPVPGRIRTDAALGYGGSLIFDIRGRTLGFKGFVSVFPAFEGFVEDERGIRPLFQLPPEPGTTAWSLYDPKQVAATRPVEVSLSLR